MFGVNSQPFLNLEKYVDLSYLSKIDAEVSRGLCKSRRVVASTGSEWSWGTAADDLYNHSFKDVELAESELSPEERSFYSSLNIIEKQKYLKYAKGAYYPWTTTLSLIEPGDWTRKMEAGGKAITDEAKELFPQTLEFVYDLSFFLEIGRICILGTDPGHHLTCHRDKKPDKYIIDDEFIFLSPRGNKPFFIYDEVEKKKHYIDCRVYTFHDCDFHGGDSCPYFNYSIRIDGKFSPEFKKSINHGRPR